MTFFWAIFQPVNEVEKHRTHTPLILINAAGILEASRSRRLHLLVLNRSPTLCGRRDMHQFRLEESAQHCAYSSHIGCERVIWKLRRSGNYDSTSEPRN